jgi:hypothetical protein
VTPKRWRSARDPRAMLELLLGSGKPSLRKLRLFACACVRRVRHLLVDRATASALELADRAADGQAVNRQLTAKRQRLNDGVKGGGTSRYLTAARRSALAAGWPRPKAMAVAQAWTWAWGAARELMRVDATRAAGEAAVSAECAAANDGLDSWDQEALYALRLVERAAQADLLRCIFGNPFRPTPPPPPSVLAWNGRLVVRLAEQAYGQRLLPSGHLDPQLLTVLADALEEAGAGAEPVDHLRGPGPHVRGCHIIDLLLNKG